MVVTKIKENWSSMEVLDGSFDLLADHSLMAGEGRLGTRSLFAETQHSMAQENSQQVTDLTVLGLTIQQ